MKKFWNTRRNINDYLYEQEEIIYNNKHNSIIFQNIQTLKIVTRSIQRIMPNLKMKMNLNFIIMKH